LASWHYWIATLGIVFYITSMWVAGIMQGLMWRAYDQFGFLQYSFAESVLAVHPYYVIRLLGGLMFLIGALIMVYNLILTVHSPITEREAVRPAPAIGLDPAIAVAGE
jgi:cytochrome c oxidase cbb3-type subunit 1